MNLLKKFINLENFAYLIVLLLPTYLVRFHFLNFPTNALEVLVFFLFIFWLVSSWKNKRNFFNFPFSGEKWLIFSIFLIFLGLLLSTLTNPEIEKSLGIIKGWFFFPILFFLLCFEIIPPARRSNLFRTHFFSCFLVAIISLFYYIFGFLTYDNRLQAFFNSPNYLAMYLSSGLIVAISFFLNCPKQLSSKKELPKKLLAGISLLIILVPFYLTFSYGAWLAVSLSFFCLFFLTQKFSFKKIFCIILVIFMVLFSQINTSKFQKIEELAERSSLSSRAMIFRSASKLISDNFFWGIGPANFQNKYLEYQKFFPPYLEWAVPHPHNIYLSFWLSGGLVSFLGFLFLVFIFLKNIFSQRNWNFLNLASLGIFFSILFHGFFDTTYFKNDLAVVFWLTFLAFSFQKKSESQLIKLPVNSVNKK